MTDEENRSRMLAIGTTDVMMNESEVRASERAREWMKQSRSVPDSGADAGKNG